MEGARRDRLRRLAASTRAPRWQSDRLAASEFNLSLDDVENFHNIVELALAVPELLEEIEALETALRAREEEDARRKAHRPLY